MTRYDKAYNQKISRVVSNFNRKVRRLEKEGAELLPSTVSVREIKELFMNRRDMNTYLRHLQRFGKRGAEEIVERDGKRYTKYEIKEFQLALRRERRRLDQAIALEEEKTSKYPLQHQITLENYKARRLKMSEGWVGLIGKPIANYLNDWTRNTITYDNYFQILFQDAYLADYDQEKLDYIRSRLLELSPNKFNAALETSPEIQEIFNYYHSLTRRKGNEDENEVKKVYDALYNNIDDIVKKYK